MRRLGPGTCLPGPRTMRRRRRNTWSNREYEERRAGRGRQSPLRRALPDPAAAAGEPPGPKPHGKPAAKSSRLRPGLIFAYAEGRGRSLADAARFEVLKIGISKTFDITPWASKNWFAVTFTGYIDVPFTGVHTFYLTSDDGSKLSIGAKEVVNNDGRHPAQRASGDIKLAAGLHPIKVSYFDVDGDEMLKVELEGPGVERQEIPASVLFHELSPHIKNENVVPVSYIEKGRRATSPARATPSLKTAPKVPARRPGRNPPSRLSGP